jgi:hypothetical protein
MTDKILWNTVKIRLPPEFITVSKNGVVNIKPPLTKKNNISKSSKEPSIKIETGNTNNVEIVQSGKKVSSEIKRVANIDNFKHGVFAIDKLQKNKIIEFNILLKNFERVLKKKEYKRKLEAFKSLVYDKTVFGVKWNEKLEDFRRLLAQDGRSRLENIRAGYL